MKRQKAGIQTYFRDFEPLCLIFVSNSITALLNNSNNSYL
jgi:hypothetical protein